MLLLNCNILFTSDPTLTTDTMMAATEGVELPNQHSSIYLIYTFPGGAYLDMPDETYNEIIRRHGTGSRGREMVFSEFLSHHPYPRWELVVKLLEMLEREGKARAGLAQEVKEKYVTSE